MAGETAGAGEAQAQGVTAPNVTDTGAVATASDVVADERTASPPQAEPDTATASDLDPALLEQARKHPTYQQTLDAEAEKKASLLYSRHIAKLDRETKARDAAAKAKADFDAEIARKRDILGRLKAKEYEALEESSNDWEQRTEAELGQLETAQQKQNVVAAALGDFATQLRQHEDLAAIPEERFREVFLDGHGGSLGAMFMAFNREVGLPASRKEYEAAIKDAADSARLDERTRMHGDRSEPDLGRPVGQNGAKLTVDTYMAMSTAERKKLPPALIDAMYAPLVAEMGS